MKAKVVGSLAGKLAIAALVGLGLAWPFAALAILTIVVAVASILSCEPRTSTAATAGAPTPDANGSRR